MERLYGARRAAPIALAAGLLLVCASLTIGKQYSAWQSAQPIAGSVNTPAAEGCPIESPDGLSLYIASNRAGNVGGAGDPNDIWVATRPSIDAPWGEPVNLGVPVNSAAADFCPTPLPGNRLLFVSTRGGPGTCGAGDIYLARRNPAHGWQIQHLGCDADGSGPNFPGGEFGPSLVETAHGTFLYFSSNGYPTAEDMDQDIYASRMRADGTFEPAVAVTELNTVSEDFMPNVRKDGLELVMNSNRPGGFGGQDLYSAYRSSTADPWSTPVNLGSAVNTGPTDTKPGNETRSSLSWDGSRLTFGRDGDIFVSERVHEPGGP